TRERVGRGVELKRRCARIVEYQQLSRMKFDVAGGKLRIACVLSTRQNFPPDRNHILATQVLGFRVCFGAVFRIKNDLSDTVSIAKIDESELAKVATFCDPAHQHDLFADVLSAELSTRV